MVGNFSISPFLFYVPNISEQEFNERPLPSVLDLRSNSFLHCDGFQLNFNFLYGPPPGNSYIEEYDLRFGNIKAQLLPTSLVLILLYVGNLFFQLFDNEDDYPQPYNTNYTAECALNYRKRVNRFQKEFPLFGRGAVPRKKDNKAKENKHFEKDTEEIIMEKQDIDENRTSIVDTWYQYKLCYVKVRVEIGSSLINLITKNSIFQVEVRNEIVIQMNKHINHLFHDNITPHIPFVVVNQYIPSENENSFEKKKEIPEDWVCVSHIRFGMKANVLEESGKQIYLIFFPLKLQKKKTSGLKTL